MGEKRTFLPYSRGITADLLRIGTLALDPFNPFELETDRFDFMEGQSWDEYDAFIRQHTGNPQIDDDCELRFAAAREWSAQISLPGLAKAHIEPSGNVKYSIQGRRCRRFEVARPIAFTTNVVLRQKGAADWIRNPLSALSSGRLQKGKSVSNLPKIWVCTGVMLINHGHVKLHSGDATTVGGGLEVDPGMLATGVPTGQTVAELQGHVTNERHVDNNYSHDDERVWAAKWFQLDVKFRTRRADDYEKEMVVKLKPIEDLKHGVRKFDSPGPGETRADADAAPDVGEVVGLEMPTAEEVGKTGDFLIDEGFYSEAMRDVDWEQWRDDETYLVNLDH